MKKLTSLLLFFFLATLITYGQQKINSAHSQLTPSRGHYKQLATFSPKPNPSNAEIDKQKFFTSKEAIEKRLSLKPVYLQNITLDDFKLPDVPANSSDQTRAEINYLLAIQKHRSVEDVRTSLYMADVYFNLSVKPSDSTYSRYRNNLFFIGRSTGSWFNPETLPVTADFMANIWRDASYFIWSLKFKYARIRPHAIDPEIKNLQETDWAAYPSGHAANSYINAYLYQELAPQFTDIFIKDAYDMAHSREILGVHFPTDSETSRIFARQFVNLLFQNEKFLKDFENVKAEWALKAKEDFQK
ncbi:MAG TPA: phosphatase PAP2 family protein [Chryseolinea sp.]|nr:phosphatase PAP2 family protein [Chryseolinea sp.]HPM29615.1 phosphatase PAP2 family protein [Chryseolinea sp.]